MVSLDVVLFYETIFVNYITATRLLVLIANDISTLMSPLLVF